MTDISGSTRLAGIIGDPIRHSLSPVLHNVAYRVLGLDWVYLAFEVPAGHAVEALAAAATLGFAGVSVTMPHKVDAAAVCDECTPEAAALCSVNTVTFEADGRLAGDSTDGEGFLRSLHDADYDPAGVKAVVLGAGGAGRAVVHALVCAGANVMVTARRIEAARDAAVVTGAAVGPWETRADAVQAATLVVNATPIGMGTDRSLPVPAAALHTGQVVADLVYHPTTTALLEAAVEQGATTIGGLGMLVHQAALQIERWTGRPGPVEEMRAAAEAALSAAAS